MIHDPVKLPPADSELAQLVELMCDGVITPAERDRLESLLENDCDAKLFYVAYLDLHAQVQWLTREAVGRDEGGRMRDEGETDLTSEQSPSFIVVEPSSVHHSAFSVQHSYLTSIPFSYLVATLVLGFGMLVAWAWKVPDSAQMVRQAVPYPSSLSPSAPLRMVGQITGEVDCQWADPHTAALDRAFVPLGRKYALASGLIEITYETGARVILQGPCTYEVDSVAGGYLAVGKLTARVEKKGSGFGVQRSESINPKSQINESEIPPNSRLSTLDSRLFTVRTPTATVIDLGTEFGVEVSEQGTTTSRVYDGSVSVQATGDGKDKERRVAALVLHENESARIERSGDKCVIVPNPSAKPAEFVRKLIRPTIKTLDLADVVAGGDGFSGRRNRGIDPRNGRPVDTWPSGDEQRFQSDGAYHRVQGMPFIDGVFIPFGKSASDHSVQLDSAGHSFEWFPAIDGHTLGCVWTGGEGGALTSTELGGIDYNAPGHSLLDMHANKGITFDLDAIRRANPDWKIIRFCGVAGNTIKGSGKNCSRYADLWVFVDGQVRFQRREITQFSGAMPAIVPLGDADRFVTLVATDGGDDYGWDHTMFGDPRLEMVLAKPTTTDPNDNREGR